MDYVDDIKCSDIDSKMTLKCEELGFETINSSVLELSDEPYDIVFGFDVLEHIVDIQEFKTKMTKIVKNLLVLQVPIDRTMVPPNEYFDGHSHYFSPKSIVSLFEEVFEPKGIFYGTRGKLARGPELLCVFTRRTPS